MAMMTPRSAAQCIAQAIVAYLRNTLPQPLFDRLMAHRQANPQTPLAKLPLGVRAEVKRILASATTENPPSPRQQASAPQTVIRPSVQQAPNGHATGMRLPPPLPDEHTRTVLGTDSTTGQAVSISLNEQFQGLYGIGATGTGKTTLLLNMILADIRAGRGIALLEPHGDLTRNVIAAMPEEQLKDVLYLDITDSACSFGLNFFESPAGADLTEVAKIASFVMHVFERVWQVGPETPRLAQVVRNTTRLLIESRMTFAEIPLLLWEDGVREKLVRRATSTQTKLFWSQYNRKTPRDRDELIASTINKVDAYLSEPLIARIVSQSASTIDFRRIMDEGKILLVNLSPQLEEASRLIGSVLIGRLLMAAFSRADTPPERRRPFLIYADEYQRYATADFAVFLAEARKFSLSTNLFHQTLEQLDDLNRATALQAGTLVVFRVSGEDSKALAPSFDTTPTPALVGEEPVLAIVADPLGHLVRQGHPDPTVAKFVSEYLMPLETLLKKVSASTHAFELGCAVVLSDHVIEGRHQLNEVFARVMREGRSDIPLPPFALFILGGAANDGSSFVFAKHLNHRLGYVPIVGLDEYARYFGQPGLHISEKQVAYILKKFAKYRVWDDMFSSRVLHPGPDFLRMLKSLRQTLEILAKEPLMTPTGLYQPKYQLRSYQDQENLVANELSQLPNYTAKVRLLSGEHTIRSNPPPPLVSEREVGGRIRAIKERMRHLGYMKSAAAIEEEVRKRHEALRARPDDDGRPIHSNGRRNPRSKPPTRA